MVDAVVSMCDDIEALWKQHSNPRKYACDISPSNQADANSK